MGPGSSSWGPNREAAWLPTHVIALPRDVHAGPDPAGVRLDLIVAGRHRLEEHVVQRRRARHGVVGHPVRRAARPERVDVGQPAAPGVITLTQPKVPEAKIRGSQKGFQWVILGLESVPPGVLKGAQRGPMGPPGPP